MYILDTPRISPERCKELAALADQLTDRRPRGTNPYQSTVGEPTIELYQPLLMDVFPGQWHDAALFILYPTSMVHIHTDGNQSYPRRHLILQTNPLCWSFHDGVWQQVELGCTYRMDPSKPHGAINSGDIVRIHLYLDLESDIQLVQAK